MAHIHEKIDFTVAAFVTFEDKVLLIHHKKLKKWLPVGGHIELDENPEVALFREIREETGIQKKYLAIQSTKPAIKSPGTEFFFTPNFLDIHDISSSHKHIGITYFLKSSTDKIRYNPEESLGLKWVPIQNLDDKTLNLSQAVKFYALEAMTHAQQQPKPRIGVGVFVMYKGKALMGHRIGAHGKDTWAPPGGHLEFGETVEECAKREVKEETGLAIKNVKQVGYTQDMFENEEKHYITVWIEAQATSANAKVLEPTKCAEWKWFELDKLPKNLFLPTKHFVEQNKT